MTLWCLLDIVMGQPVEQAGLSPIRTGNSYTVTSWKETAEDDLGAMAMLWNGAVVLVM